MPSNFDFLESNWSFLHKETKRVEAFAFRDPRTAAFYARRTLELGLAWLYKNDTSLKAPFERNLAAMIHEPTFKGAIKPGLFNDIKYIHRLGNLAAHDDKPISTQEGMKACVALFQFTGWLARVYTRGGPAPGQFNITLLPPAEGDAKNEAEAKESKKAEQAAIIQLQKVREELARRDEAERKALEAQQHSEAEIAQLKEQLALLQVTKEENKKKIPAGDYSESQTRDEFIDVMLREAGWDPKAKNVEEYEVHGMPSNSGVGYVDYVLWGEDGLPLAVVEAKKTKVNAKVGKHQAELYADCLEKKFNRRPVIFYTNGYTTWFWDDTQYPPREVHGFYTRDELSWLLNRRSGKQNLLQISPDADVAGRPYQLEATARVMQAFEEQNKRKALIVMATGTGKTRLSMSIVDVLMRGNWIRRVLFLADRISLVKQAKKNFVANIPAYSTTNLLESASKEEREAARVVFSTYPTMLNLIDGTKKNQTETFSVGHFDLIIIDEAHRSVYQKYGAIFDYFDSLLIGLTATPRGELDRNTYRLFELADHQPTFAYELKDAVEDGFLNPPRAISVPLQFQREGIKYHELSEEEQEEYELEEQFYDEQGQLKTEIGSAALNKWLFNKDTVNKVLMHLMENGLRVGGGDTLGKTIIFAKNSKHAEFIVEQFDANYPHLAGKFCRQVDYSVKYVQSLIDDFELQEKMPQIAVSVDMLDTGIDVPPILNLVFFKMVRSKTKFWQMIGRGTRLCPDIFGPGQHKKEFIVFDYCENLEFFDANPDGYEPRTQESVKQRIFRRRLELATVLQQAQAEEQGLNDLAEQLKNQMHEIVCSLNVDNFLVRKHRETVEQYTDRARWDSLAEKDIESLGNKIASLPWADDDEETARRLDLLILNLQVALLQKSSSVKNYIKAVKKTAADLEQKQAIPMVAQQIELILALQTDAWWQNVSLPILEDVRLKLRGLVRFADPNVSYYETYTDFEDSIDLTGIAEHEIVKADPNLSDYRSRVERYIREHKDHITIRRLRNNQPVSETDIGALEDLLFHEAEVIPRVEYSRIYGEKPLGLLVRSIVGLDRKAAKDAFAEFIAKAPLHPDQIRFLDEVVSYLVKNGVMEEKELFDEPFTHHHDHGVVGIMGDERAKEVLELVRTIRRNAYDPKDGLDAAGN